MGTVSVLRALLTGWGGAPGYTIFNFCAAGEIPPTQAMCQEFATNVAAMYTGVKAWIRMPIKIDIEPEVKTYDIATGTPQDLIGFTPPAQVEGTGSNTTSTLPYSTMVNVQLVTDAVRNGRIVKGRHFHGPIAGSTMDIDGTIKDTALAAFQTNYGGLLDVVAPRLVVWSRPVGGAGGAIGYVQSVKPKQMPGYLKNRAR